MLIVENSYWAINSAPSFCYLPELEIFATNWSELENWLKFSMRVRDKIQCHAFVSSTLFARRVPWRYQLKYQIFYLRDDKWLELTPRAEILTSQVPDWAIEGIFGAEVNVSDRFQENIDWTGY